MLSSPPTIIIPTREQVRNELARRELWRYVEATWDKELHEWQHILCERLERLKWERGARILIHGPPQYGKSIILTKRFPAWMLGQDPNLRIVVAAYNQTHAGTMTSVVRDLLRNPEHKAIFPAVGARLVEPSAEGEFFTRERYSHLDSQPSVRAVGIQSGFTGTGADLLIIDDPYASPEDARSETINSKTCRWYDETASVRVDDEANVVCMFHRYGEEDIAGHLMATGDWEMIRFPAIADGNEEGDDPTGRKPGELLSPRRSLAWLHKQQEKDPQVWLSMFQGRPRPPEGAYIKRDDLYICTSGEPKLDRWVRYWDLATSEKETGDWTVGVMMGVDSDHCLHIRDIQRFRLEWPDAAERIAEVAEADEKWARANDTRVVHGVERVGALQALVQDLFRKGIFIKEGTNAGPANRVVLIPNPARGDKKSRAGGWVARARQGKLHLHNVTLWDVVAFIKECLIFTGDGTTKDDQVDAVSGGYEVLYKKNGGKKKPKPLPEAGSIAYYAALARQRGAS